MRIENLSDQVMAYSEEIASTVNQLCKDFGYSRKESIQCVQLAINNMMTDVFHHIEDDLSHLDGTIYDLSRSLRDD